MTAFLFIIGFVLIVVGGMLCSIRSTVDDARRSLGSWEEVPAQQRRFERRSSLTGAALLVIGFFLLFPAMP